MPLPYSSRPPQPFLTPTQIDREREHYKQRCQVLEHQLATKSILLAHAQDTISRLEQTIALLAPAWPCRCGAKNGVNLAQCAVCLRPRSEALVLEA